MIPRPLVCCIYVTVPCGTMIFDFWFDFCWRECWKNKMFLIVYMTWIEIKFYLLTFQKRLLIIVMYIETLNFPSMYSLQCADFPKVMIAKYSKSEYFLNDNGIVYIFRELITFICHIFMQELWQIIVITIERIIILFATLPSIFGIILNINYIMVTEFLLLLGC